MDGTRFQQLRVLRSINLDEHRDLSEFKKYVPKSEILKAKLDRTKAFLRKGDGVLKLETQPVDRAKTSKFFYPYLELLPDGRLTIQNKQELERFMTTFKEEYYAWVFCEPHTYNKLIGSYIFTPYSLEQFAYAEKMYQDGNKTFQLKGTPYTLTFEERKDDTQVFSQTNPATGAVRRVLRLPVNEAKSLLIKNEIRTMLESSGGNTELLPEFFSSHINNSYYERLLDQEKFVSKKYEMLLEQEEKYYDAFSLLSPNDVINILVETGTEEQKLDNEGNALWGAIY